jgi:hypothetical protein
MATPAQLAEAVSYTRAHRTDDRADVALECVSTSGDGAVLTEPYARAGLTWWVEALGWFRGPLDACRERVRQGPPRD